MRFEWDAEENRRNLARHGISFDTACFIFEDPHALSYQERIVEDEVRWQTFGLVGNAVLMVAHTSREEDDSEEVIRVISARRANAYERSVYEAHKKST